MTQYETQSITVTVHNDNVDYAVKNKYNNLEYNTKTAVQHTVQMKT